MNIQPIEEAPFLTPDEFEAIREGDPQDGLVVRWYRVQIGLRGSAIVWEVRAMYHREEVPWAHHPFSQTGMHGQPFKNEWAVWKRILYPPDRVYGRFTSTGRYLGWDHRSVGAPTRVDRHKGGVGAFASLSAACEEVGRALERQVAAREEELRSVDEARRGFAEWRIDQENPQ